MAISELSRDYGRNPAIVRMVSDDTLETILGATYIADQEVNIDQVNFGGFEWKDSDVLLVQASDGKAFLDVNVALDGTVTFSARGASAENVTYTKEADDATAATATAETPLLSPAAGAVLTGAWFLPSAALTADNTDFATLSLVNRDAAGSVVGTIAEITTEITGTGDWVAFVAESFGDLANATIEAGGSVTFEITKDGAGVVVPAGALQLEYVAL